MEHEITAADLRKISAEPCAMCKARGKTWNEGDPECSFPGGGKFNSDGWNCATANAIRDLCGQDEPCEAADYRYCDDQNYSTIKIDGVDMPSDGRWLALWVSWYKHRGRTEAMWLLSEYDPPKQPDAAECEAIIGHFRGRGQSPPGPRRG